MSDADKTFSGSVGFFLRIWWHHVHTLCKPYRSRIPKVTAPVTFGFSRQKGPLLSGSRYLLVDVTLRGLENICTLIHSYIYRNANVYTLSFDPSANQKQRINRSFKNISVQLTIKVHYTVMKHDKVVFATVLECSECFMRGFGFVICPFVIWCRGNGMKSNKTRLFCILYSDKR